MRRTFRSTFFAGLFICLPLVVTLLTIQFAFARVQDLVAPVLLEALNLMGLGGWLDGAWSDYLAPAVSVAVAVLAIWVTGLVGSNVIGRQLLMLVERLVLHVPVVKSIYGATRQFIEAFAQGSGRSFSRVVLVAYPRPGVWTLGLVTNSGHTEVARKVGQNLVSVFLPTTPNPTSGWLAFIPESELITLEMSVDDAFRLIVSGGVLSGSVAPGSAVPLAQAEAAAQTEA